MIRAESPAHSPRAKLAVIHLCSSCQLCKILSQGETMSDKQGSLIALHNVHKIYKTAAGEFPALKGIDLKVDRGEFVAVIGKSGSGKTTLINMITGIDRPTEGEVVVADTPIHNMKEGKLAEWRGRNIGVIFQFFQLLPTLTAIENVMLPMDFCNMYSTKERPERALHLLDQVGLADQAYKIPSTLSGGQQQRVAIARALSNDPPLLLADEPTGNLDSKTAGSVFEVFENFIAQGKTIVMVTHDNDLASRVTRDITVADGIIESDASVERNLSNNGHHEDAIKETANA